MDDRISRLLHADMIDLDPAIRFPEPPEDPIRMDDHNWRCKEMVLQRLVDVFSRSGQVRNSVKLFKDLASREHRVTTAIGEGLAIPHVRTMQPRDLVMCFLRFREGVPFGSPDGSPVHFMFGIITPPYEDRAYLQVLAWIGRIFRDCFWLKDSLMAAENAEEVRGIFVGLAKGVM